MSQIVHETRHWHTSPYPLLVGFGTCLFMPTAFMLHFNYGLTTAAIVALTLGVILMIVGGLGWAGETIGIIDDEGWSPAAMFMFIGTEVMTVSGVVAAYWVTRLGASSWPPEGTPEIHAPVIATVLLMISSVTIGMARKKQINGDASGFAMLSLVTVVIWAVFMSDVLSNWAALGAQGFTAGVNGYATALYSFTGIHVAHIIIGILVILTPLKSAFAGRTSDSYTRCVTMYVHFVNILGLMTLFQVYLWA
ncbi:MAG: cytochrome c oxidase subunit 3 [Mariprofundaceae bacterium]